MADLRGKVAVVVDVGDDLGRGIVEGLAEAGATVYVTAQAAGDAVAPLDGVVERARELGGTAFAVTLDGTCERALEALVERIRAEQGRLDVLVCRAAGPVRELPRLAAPAMAGQGSGLIVCIAGWEGEQAAGAGGSAPRRAAALTRDLGRELAPGGVAALALRAAAVAAPAQPQPGSAAPSAGPAPTSMRFNGRCVAALAMDPDILEKAGGDYGVTELQREYRFSDPAWT